MNVAVILLAASAFGCAGTARSGGAAAPTLPVASFQSLGPADAPGRMQKCGNTDPAKECTGPLVAVSAQPTDADFAAAKAAGYRTIVNFRTPGEPGYVDERATVESLGMRYVAIPVADRNILSEHVAQLDPVLRDASAGPILLHCKSGARAKLAWDAWVAGEAPSVLRK